jgi:predicted nucleic-acid-binding protein
LTAPKEPKQSDQRKHPESGESQNPFRLEEIFEDAAQIFRPYRVSAASREDVLIAVDTNVLLLPYTIRKDGLPKLEQFYEKLRADKRLFLPERVAREFILHRDKKLAELIKTINDLKSRIASGETPLSPILEGVEGSEALAAASKALHSARSDYAKALDSIEAKVRAWSGDDPVTAIYAKVFSADNIVGTSQPRDDLRKEWARRSLEQIPPGYKDSSKSDSGIGDFLVWKSLLEIGSKYKKDLIFVTGDEKSDWFIRANGAGAYPRPELIAEYRRHSEGSNLRLISFHDVLREMSVPSDVVSEVENAEASINSEIRPGRPFGIFRKQFRSISVVPYGQILPIEFVLHYGGELVRFVSETSHFGFSVSDASVNNIYIYPNNTSQFFRLAEGKPGETIQLEKFATENFVLAAGETFALRNALGETLVLRLVSSTSPEDREMEVQFVAALFRGDEPAVYI